MRAVTMGSLLLLACWAMAEIAKAAATLPPGPGATG